MTTYSLIDCVTFLLNEGVDYVLTENFCQDDLENDFGTHRSIGHRKDNPNIQAFLYQDNLIISTINVAPIGSNVSHGALNGIILQIHHCPKEIKQIK